MIWLRSAKRQEVAEPPPFDAAACLERTRGELSEIAMSLKFRDVVRRNGLADRCAACALCPELTD